jgi:hypothetical protein
MGFGGILKGNLKWIALPGLVVFIAFKVYEEGSVHPVTVLLSLIRALVYVVVFTILQVIVGKLIIRVFRKHDRSGTG